MNILPPLMDQPSPSGEAVVRIRERSDPAFGSVRHIDVACCGEQATDGSCTSLADSRTAGSLRSYQARQPGQAIKTGALRHADSEHPRIDECRIQVPPFQFFSRDIGGEPHGMEVGKAPLPIGKRRAPIAAIRYPCVHATCSPNSFC